MTLKVAVDDGWPARMEVRHAPRGVLEHPQQQRPVDGDGGVVEDAVEAAARHVLHDDADVRGVEGGAEELQDVRRPQRSHEVHLLLVFAHKVLVHVHGVEALDGDDSAAPCPLVHLAERPAPDAVFHLDVPEVHLHLALLNLVVSVDKVPVADPHNHEHEQNYNGENDAAQKDPLRALEAVQLFPERKVNGEAVLLPVQGDAQLRGLGAVPGRRVARDAVAATPEDPACYAHRARGCKAAAVRPGGRKVTVHMHLSTSLQRRDLRLDAADDDVGVVEVLEPRVDLGAVAQKEGEVDALGVRNGARAREESARDDLGGHRHVSKQALSGYV